MGDLPEFDSKGLLPPGDYELTIEELKNSCLVNGFENASAHWDADWRSYLVDNLEIMVGQLWRVGIRDILIDGSFVENKDHPNDIDGYFVCDFFELISGNIERQLNVLEPEKIWTWDPNSRRPYQNYPKQQLPMWHKYRVELFPHYGNGPETGIQDEYGNDLLFPAAFRRSRQNGEPRGIIKIGGHQ